MEAKMMKMKNDKKRRNERYRQKSKEEDVQGSQRIAINEKKRARYKMNADSICWQKKVYYKTNANSILQKRKIQYDIYAESIRQKRKVHYETNTDHISNKKKMYYKSNATVICEKRLNHYYHSNSTGQECSFTCSESENSFTPTNNQENTTCNQNFLPRELNESEMEKIVQKIREKICLSTAVDGDINRHRAHVCVVCDRLIIGLEEVKFIEKETLLESSSKLAVSSYEEYYDGVPMHPELVKQYQVEDCDLKHLLLSPRARVDQKGYECCEMCFGSLRCSRNKDQDKPPKFAIANGFAIGHIPEVINFHDKNGNIKNRSINAEIELDDLLCASISPVRPFGYVHAYTGGSQKSLKGHFSNQKEYYKQSCS
jgi:hypothetical protein